MFANSTHKNHWILSADDLLNKRLELFDDSASPKKRKRIARSKTDKAIQQQLEIEANALERFQDICEKSFSIQTIVTKNC